MISEICGSSRNLKQLRLSPGFFAFLGLGANGFDQFRFDWISGVAPLAADEGQDRRDLVIVKNAERRHVELKGFAFDIDGAVQALQHDAHESLRGAEHPFGVHQCRREPFLAHAVRLMARAATDQVKLLTLLKTLLLFRRQRPDGNLRFGSRFAGPGEDRKSTRLNSSHTVISYAVFCLKKK